MLKQFKHRMCIALKRFQKQLMEPYISLYLITGKGGGVLVLNVFFHLVIPVCTLNEYFLSIYFYKKKKRLNSYKGIRCMILLTRDIIFGHMTPCFLRLIPPPLPPFSLHSSGTHFFKVVVLKN